MVNFDCGDFKIIKFIYKLKYDDFGTHLKNTLKVKDGVKIVDILTEYRHANHQLNNYIIGIWCLLTVKIEI